MSDAVAIFSNNVSPGVGHIAKTISESSCRDGSRRFVLFATRETTKPLFDHDITFPHLESVPHLEIRGHGEQPDLRLDTLLVTWSHWVPYTDAQLQFLRHKWLRARRRVLLYDASFGLFRQRFVQQARDLFRHPWLARVDEVCYMSVWPSADLFARFKRRYGYCTGPTVDVLFDPQLERLLHLPYEVEQRRLYFMLVSGARGSARRAAILDGMEAESSDRLRILRHEDAFQRPAGVNGKTVYWRIGGNGMPHAAFIGIMAASDFVLCLPGDFWTTRPYEALARGAIPILGDDFLHSYDVDWEDGENCVLVRNANQPSRWMEAVRRASQMPEDQILHMRRQIWKLSDERLRPERARARLLTRLGLC